MKQETTTRNENRVAIHQAICLAALHHHWNDNDPRPYLRGYHIIPHKDGGVRLAATNGHTIMVIHDRDGYANGSYIVRPSKRIIGLAAMKETRRTTPFDVPHYVEYGPTMAMLTTQHRMSTCREETGRPPTAIASLEDGVLIAEPCPSVEGPFPDIARAIGGEVEQRESMVAVNPAFLALTQKSIAPLMRNRHHGITIEISTEMNVVSMRPTGLTVPNIEVYIGIMPMRADLPQLTKKVAPEWAFRTDLQYSNT